MNCKSIIRLVALTAILFIGIGCANRLAPHRDLLVGAPAANVPAPRSNALTVTYLGVNGYLLRSGDTAILVDPYFSRIPLREIALNAPIEPSPDSITAAIREGNLEAGVDAILVTHAHFDHLLDVPDVQRILGGKIITSPTGTFLCEASGVRKADLLPSKADAVHRIGTATITVLAAEHDKVLGKVPYRGEHDSLPQKPVRPKDWVLGTPLAFLVEMGGARIYIESGGVKGSPPSVSDVDLAIVGTAVGNVDRYREAVTQLNPRYVLPSHQDNFFIPLESGFHFSVLSDFPRLISTHRAEGLPGTLVLMDYFHTWTFPELRPAAPATGFARFREWFRDLFGREARD